MADNTLAHARTGLIIVRWRYSLSHAPTCLAAACLRHSLAHGLTDSPAAQSLRDGPQAARLWGRGVACGLKRLTYLWGMSNNTLQGSAGSAVHVVGSVPSPAPPKRER